jgi:3-phenylpropionate/trans-cinnamate dioxygenase ferredoxin reductase component
LVLHEGSTVVVVGASLAGLRAAEALRAQEFRGRIILIGAEPHLPYDRPPLSKQFLAGTWGLDRVRLRDEDKLESLGLELRLGCEVTGLDVDGHHVEVGGDGESVAYDGLVIATGARPRTLTGTAGVAGIHCLRTLDDSMAIASATAAEGTRLVVVGAGFIGSEVAATCHSRGVDVTVVEALAVPLGRVLGEEMGAACGALHARHGVAVRTGASVVDVLTEVPDIAASASVTGSGAKVVGMELSDGAVIDADVVVVGVGVEPVTGWLEDSGLDLSNGVVADSTLHAADDIVVAGDVARWFEQRQQEHIRIEHWTNAAEQGAACAASLLAGRADAEPYVPVPYFWSDQYDIKIQMIGYPHPDDDVVVVDGSLSDGRFVALYGRGGRLSAALGFSRPRRLMGYRPLLEAGSSFDDALALQP